MDSFWNGAKFIRTDFIPYFSYTDNPWDFRPHIFRQHLDLVHWRGLPIFIKEFDVDKVGNGKIYFAALGLIDVYLNGKRVGNDELKPGCVSFDKRTFYHEYDVSEQLIQGKNRVVAVLSAGWYSGRIAGKFYGAHEPAFMMSIINDSKAVLVSDESFKTSVNGRIRTADIWDGEYCDGRDYSYEEMSTPVYDISKWGNATVCDYFDGKVTKFMGAPVRVRDEMSLKPDKMTIFDGVKYNGSDFGEVNVSSAPEKFPFTLKKGQKLTVDFAQESVGWIKLSLKGKKDTEVKIRYAEFINDSGEKSRGNDGPKGSVYTVNLRSALCKAYYVLNGKGEECYRPLFTFFGYRFAEISATDDTEIIDITGEVVGSDNRETGFLETSNQLVNKLISNTLWGQRGNYLSIPTDCPQRDERLGWTCDTQAFCRTATYNADVLEFFRKWLQDMRDSQSEDGAYPFVAPRMGCCREDNASAWSDAGIIVPYIINLVYDDKEMLSEHYESMEKYIEFLVRTNKMAGANPVFGDWLAYDLCDGKFVSSAYFVYDIDLMIKMSEVLGKSDRVEYYKKLRKEAYEYFHLNFLDENGKPKGNTQTDKVLCLAFDLLDESKRNEVADELTAQIKENGHRLSTGFLGTYLLCTTLSRFGKDKTAYDLLMQRNEPSWLYSIDQGATTVWERWNTYTKEKGFGEVGMNSFNHYAYGAVVEWMYRYMAGIETDGRGFKKILLQPRVDTRTVEELPEGQQRMKWVKASYNSSSGMIKSAWSNEDGFLYECAVPENASATLLLPVFTEKVLINGIEHSFSEYEKKDGCAVIHIAPGEYVFEEV